MSLIDGVVRVDQQGDKVILLGLVGIVKFLKGLHLLHVAGLGSDLLPAIHTIREYHLQRTAHVIERSVMPSPGLARLLRLHAADDVVGSGILQSQAAAHQRRDDNLIVVVCRQTDACPGQFRRPNQEFMGRSVPHPDGQRRLGQEHMGGSVNAHEGEIVCHIQPLRVLAAHNQVLEQAVTSKSLGALRISALVQVIELDPHTVDQFLGLLSRHPARFQIRLIIGVHILIKPSRGDRVSRGLHLQKLLHKPETLTGLPESLRPLSRHSPAVCRDGQKLLLSRPIPAFCRLALRQIRVAVRVSDNRRAADQHGFQQHMLRGVIRVSHAAARQFPANFLHDALESDSQHLLILYRHMPHTVVEIISRREHVVGHGPQCLRRHIRCGQLAGGLPLPVPVRLGDLLFRLFRYVEGIRLPGGHRVKLRLQPLKGKLRECLTAPGRDGGTAHNQLLLTDNNRNVVENMGKSLRLAHDFRLVLRLPVGFRKQHCPGRLDLRHLRVQVLHQAGNPLALWRLRTVILCHSITSLEKQHNPT